MCLEVSLPGEGVLGEGSRGEGSGRHHGSGRLLGQKALSLLGEEGLGE